MNTYILADVTNDYKLTVDLKLVVKIALFLGAGASVPFDKPITTDMKYKLYGKYDASHQGGFLYSFLNCYHFTDIEHVLQSLRDLKSLWSNYGGKYFQTRDIDLVVKSKTRDIQFSDFVKQVEEVEKTIIREVFLNYSWNPLHEEKLKQISSK